MAECAVCGAAAGKRCAACRLAYYCGRRHQLDDWPRHRRDHELQDSEVHAPIDGVVTATDDAAGVVTVYVAATDSHVIYSPTGGVTAYTRTESGVWERPGLFRVPDQTKTGRLVVGVRTLAGRTYEYWIEVGRGAYITDAIRFEAGEPGARVFSRQRVGEIVIGSLYEMHMPGRTQLLVRPGDRLTGGGAQVVARFL